VQVKVLPLVHPKSIMKGGWGKEMFQVMYLKRLKQWAFDKRPCEPVDVTQPPPKANLFPTLDEIKEFLADPRCSSEGVAIDLEAAGPHPRCLGIMLVESEEYICIHFRHQGGAIYWSYTDLCTIVGLLQLFLADPTVPKVFQNGQAYDVPELEELGFEVNGYWPDGFDPMIAHRYMYGESPADLQTLGIAYGGLSAWKRLVKEDDEGEGK
jgi:hypothetical protein